MGDIGGGPSKNIFKGHVFKAREGSRYEGGRGGWLRWGAVVGDNGDNCG